MATGREANRGTDRGPSCAGAGFRTAVPVLLGAVATALAVAAGARADGPPARTVPGERTRSVHETEWRAHRGEAPAPPVPRRPAPPPRSLGTLTHEVHGYHPWWMGTAYESYDWSLLSTVAFFSLELDAAGNVTDAHGWPWVGLVALAHQHGVRVIVTATMFSIADIDALLSDPAGRQAAVANLVAAVLAGGADGVSVDFEGVLHARKQDLVTFLGELQAALAAAVPDPYVSIATPAVDWADAFDYDALAARCNHLMVMAYDYHWSGSATSGPVAPLGGWGTYNVPWTVQDYQTWGALPGQMLLGVPYYGYRWNTVTGNAGAVTDSAGVARTYAQAAGDAAAHGLLWDAPSVTPWTRWQDPAWKQLWFDDDVSLRAKYDFVAGEGLAGVGIWALGYDGARPELWQALAESFSTQVAAPETGSGAATLRLAGRNPFRDRVDLSFSLPRSGPLAVVVYDVAGRRVRTLRAGPAPAGPGRVTWNGTGPSGGPVAAGTYFVRLEAGGGRRTVPVVRLR